MADTSFTQAQLKMLVREGAAVDISRDTKKRAGWFKTLGISSGVAGVNGVLLKNTSSGKLYVIIGRTPALFIYLA